MFWCFLPSEASNLSSYSKVEDAALEAWQVLVVFLRYFNSLLEVVTVSFLFKRCNLQKFVAIVASEVMLFLLTMGSLTVAMR